MRAVVTATVLFAAAAPLAAQHLSRMPVEAKNLVVSVLATGGEDEEVGAGVVVGVSAQNRVIIATAAHVVRTAQDSAKIKVVFQFARNDTLEARVEQVDRERDLAVLSVTPRTATAAAQFTFDREGDPAALALGALVVPVGCPERVCWEPPVSGDRVISAGARRVRFESFFVSPGSSGGALFNQQWEVVGIVTEKNSQDGVALGISEVADRLRQWGITMQLRPTSIPRAGYGTRFSLVGLTSSDGLHQAGRWPSGRLALFLRGQERLGWHVSAIRLAPLNLRVLGGMVGTSVSIRSGRFGVAPFAEVGAARVEGRYKSGSYFIQSLGNTVEVPIWRTLTNDVIGFGVGADLEFLVVPHVALSGLIGHWSFRTEGQLPSVPNVFVGAGLKYAF